MEVLDYQIEMKKQSSTFGRWAFWINRVLFIVTMAGFLTIYFGMLSSILLGAVNLITAVIALIVFQNHQKTKAHLTNYLVIAGFILTGIFGIPWLIMETTDLPDWMEIPAIYYFIQLAAAAMGASWYLQKILKAYV